MSEGPMDRTTDEPDITPEEFQSDASRDDWLAEQVPPHHDGG